MNIDIRKLCFQGPKEKLAMTEITQPAVLAVSMAVYEILMERGFKPDFVAGHSLGEYSALTAAGTFTLTDALGIVAKRGKWMSEAMPAGQGTMAAVLGLGVEEVNRICSSASLSGEVVPANFNCPGQTVISGTREAVEKAAALAGERGAKRVLPLAVSGPFHSRFMEGVSHKLAGLLDTFSMEAPEYSFVANVTGKEIQKADKIKEALVKQVMCPVLWQQSVEYLIGQGASVFVEVGPGRVLSGLIRKIDRRVKVLNVEDCETLENVSKVLEEVKG